MPWQLLSSFTVLVLAFAQTEAWACSWEASLPYLPDESPEFSYVGNTPSSVDMLPRLLVNSAELSRAQFGNSSCSGEAFLVVEVELANYRPYRLEEIGFYFLVVDGFDDNGIIPNIPISATRSSIDLELPRDQFGTIVWHFQEWGVAASRPVNLDVLVFAVGPDHSIGHPTRFTIHSDPTATPD